MGLAVKEFYYFYNFFDLVKAFDPCPILLVYKKVGKQTVDKLEFDCHHREKQFINLANIYPSESAKRNSVLIGVTDNLAANQYWLNEAFLIKSLLADFSDAIAQLRKRELIPIEFYLNEENHKSLIDSVVIDLKEKYAVGPGDTNTLLILFYLIDLYGLGVFDFVFWIYEREEKRLYSGGKHSVPLYGRYGIDDVIIKYPVLYFEVDFLKYGKDEHPFPDIIYTDNRLNFVPLVDIIESGTFTATSSSKYDLRNASSAFMRCISEWPVELLQVMPTSDELKFIMSLSNLSTLDFQNEHFQNILQDVISDDKLAAFVRRLFTLGSNHNQSFLEFYFNTIRRKGGDLQVAPIVMHPILLHLKASALNLLRVFLDQQPDEEEDS